MPQEIDEADYYHGIKRNPEEGMGEAAVVSEAKGPAAKTSNDVEIRRLCGERQRERGERRLAVESGAPQARAGQEVGDGFQAVREILFRRASKTNRDDSAKLIRRANQSEVAK